MHRDLFRLLVLLTVVRLLSVTVAGDYGPLQAGGQASGRSEAICLCVRTRKIIH